MRQLKKEELGTLLAEYHNHGYKSQKPLLLWIDDAETYNDLKGELKQRGYAKAEHPYREHELAKIEGKIVKVSDYPELLGNDISRAEYENVKGLVYFSSIPVVFMYDLEYGADQSRKLQIPYICLMHEGTHLMHKDIDTEIDENSRLYMNDKFDNYLIK